MLKNSRPYDFIKDHKVLPVLFVAFLIRILTASLPNFSEDEAFSYYLSRLSLKDILSYIPLDRHPPLHYFLMHFLTRLTHSELTLRIPSIVFALLSVFIVYKISSLLTQNDSISSTAAFFSAVFFSFWHSDIPARMFSMAQCFQLAGTYFWIKILLEEKSKISFYGYYLLFMGLAMYTLYFSGFILFGQVFGLLVLNPKKRLSWLTLGVLTILAFPLGLLIHLQRQAKNLVFLAAIKSYWEAFYFNFLGIVPFMQAKNQSQSFSSYTFAIFGMLSVLIIAAEFYALNIFSKKNKKRVLFLVFLIVGYLLPIALESLWLKEFDLRERYFLLAYPYLGILLAIAMFQIPYTALRRTLIIGLAYINIYLFFSYNMNPYLWGYNMNPLAMEFKHHVQEGDVLVAYVPTTAFYLFNYYYDYRSIRFLLMNNKPEKKPIFAFTYSGETPEDYLPDLDSQPSDSLKKTAAKLKRYKRTWLLVNKLPWTDQSLGVHQKHQEIRHIFGKNFNAERSLATKNAFELNYEDKYYLYELIPKNR